MQITEEEKNNIMILFNNLTQRYNKINSIKVAIEPDGNVIFKKVMLTDRENNFMEDFINKYGGNNE